MNNSEYLVVELTPQEHKRIFAKIAIDEKTGCWNWTGGKDHQGYPQGFYRGKRERAHRIVYAYFKGPIPRGVVARRFAQLDHLCRNTSCCNPEHIELVTQKTNTQRSNSPAGINYRKTHCIHGHKLPEDRTRNGKRRDCRICDSIRHKKRMTGEKRDYWLKKQRQAVRRYYQKKHLS